MTSNPVSVSPDPKVALLDADFLVYRIGFASEEDTEEYAKARLVERLKDIVYFELNCDDYKAYITGKGNYRNEIAVTQPYKGNRKDMKKPKHYEALRDHLVRLGAVVTEGIEADDAVGIEAAKMQDTCWIVHQDKDLDQLPGWHYNPVKLEKYHVRDFDGLHSFYTQLLVGDRTDHIKGLWKVGPVKAEKYLKGCKTEQELYEACVRAYEEHNEAPERLLENGRLLWLQRKEGELWSPPVETVECEAEGTPLAAEG